MGAGTDNGTDAYLDGLCNGAIKKHHDEKICWQSGWVGGWGKGRVGRRQKKCPGGGRGQPVLPSSGLHSGWIRRLHPCRGSEQSKSSGGCVEVGNGTSLLGFER